jgi:hypothetical protein
MTKEHYAEYPLTSRGTRVNTREMQEKHVSVAHMKEAICRSNVSNCWNRK